jgi:hypothetical protein
VLASLDGHVVLRHREVGGVETGVDAARWLLANGGESLLPSQGSALS